MCLFQSDSNWFLQILAFVAVVSARPEAGYNYNAPNRGTQQLTQSTGSFGGTGFGVGTSSFNTGAAGGYSGASTGYSGGYSSGVSSGGFASGVSSGGFSSGVSSGGFAFGGKFSHPMELF